MPGSYRSWYRRARASVSVATFPVALALPLELAFWGNMSEHGWSSGKALTLSGAALVTSWELAPTLLVWALCVLQVLRAGADLAPVLVRSRGALQRLAVLALVVSPLVSVTLGLMMLHFSAVLRPALVGWVHNGVTGATVYSYLPGGNAVLSSALQWAGLVVLAAGWAGGLIGLAWLVSGTEVSQSSLSQGVVNARTTAMAHAVLVAGLVVIELTTALQTPLGNEGGLAYGSRFGPWAVPSLVLFASVGVVALLGARAAGEADAQSRRLLRDQPPI